MTFTTRKSHLSQIYQFGSLQSACKQILCLTWTQSKTQEAEKVRSNSVTVWVLRKLMPRWRGELLRIAASDAHIVSGESSMISAFHSMKVELERGHSRLETKQRWHSILRNKSAWADARPSISRANKWLTKNLKAKFSLHCFSSKICLEFSLWQI